MKFLTNNLRISSIIPLLETENDFIFIRSYLLNRPTATEQQITTRKTKAVDSIRHDSTNDPLDQKSLKPKSERIENLIIHYAHEARLTTYNESRKRKRDDQSIQKSLNSSTKSMSQLSVSQAAVPKKMKRSTVDTIFSNNEISTQTNSQNYMLYKPSKYLKMSQRLLLHSVHLQLNCPLKKKKERCFVLSRLKIIDQQFCLEQIRYLYQNYLDLGSQQIVSF